MIRISVITVCRDPGERLLATLASVAHEAERIPGIEHIIIDGGSRDGTQERLAAWQRHSIEWTSEADDGISHAFNKGLARARGEIVGILNADDAYTPGAIQRGLDALDAAPQAGFCFGHCLHLEADGRTWLNLADPDYHRHMRWFMPNVNHPTMLVRRSTYDRVGDYDARYRFAMDYDWLCRAEAAGIRGVMVDSLQTQMAMGGRSDRFWWRAYAEARNISIRYGAPASLAYVDHITRLAKGALRRTLARIGAERTVHAVRLWRQARIISGSKRNHSHDTSSLF